MTSVAFQQVQSRIKAYVADVPAGTWTAEDCALVAEVLVKIIRCRQMQGDIRGDNAVQPLRRMIRDALNLAPGRTWTEAEARLFLTAQEQILRERERQSTGVLAFLGPRRRRRND
jgi:hypothetical protein